jgi:hypothetical protein
MKRNVDVETPSNDQIHNVNPPLLLFFTRICAQRHIGVVDRLEGLVIHEWLLDPQVVGRYCLKLVVLS